MAELRKVAAYVLAVPKSLFFNLYYFGLKGLRLPVLISHRVFLKRMKGKVILTEQSFAKVKIGFDDVGIFDKRRQRTIWEVTGTIHFQGSAFIGHGSRLAIHGDLTVGGGLIVTAESQIICFDRIQFGKDCLVSWDTLFMDTDFHKIFDQRTNNRLNHDSSIKIEDNSWIGCRCIVLKGSVIPKGSILGAGSISGRLKRENRVFAGSPPHQIREAITGRNENSK